MQHFFHYRLETIPSKSVENSELDENMDKSILLANSTATESQAKKSNACNLGIAGQ